MPYYVYAIHTDQTGNRLYQRFDDFRQAEKLEKEMKAGGYPDDNYFVQLICADNKGDADVKADALRPFPRHDKKG